MVIFVRFADDVLAGPNWPDYHVLPQWASTFVDPVIPSGNMYPNLNLSNFMDRGSGGNGAGSLGALQIIGDVYYITTDNPRASYTTDYAVNIHFWQKLDNQGVDFSLYDNWEFMVGQYYTHENHPDGTVDFIFMIWRDHSFQPATIVSRSGIGGYVPLAGSYTTSQGMIIDSYSGSNQFLYRDYGGSFQSAPTATYVPAHEYTHYLFGWESGPSHIGQGGINTGQVSFFALMVPSGPGSYSAYERYRLGWLNPDIVVTNIGYVPIPDTHVKNKAVMIPIRRDANNEIREYFLIENYHSLNDYAGANPFLRRQAFTNIFSQGLLAFHIRDEHLTMPTGSIIDIKCADGVWQWNVIQGASTPSDRKDDLIGKTAPLYHYGYDERDLIAITVGGVNWIDYAAQKTSDNGCGTGSPCIITPTCKTTTDCNHGWRYTKSSILGDNEDFFRVGETDVFSSFSNPFKVDLLEEFLNFYFWYPICLQ